MANPQTITDTNTNNKTNTNKKVKGLTIGLVVTSLLAVAGIAFGIYGIVGSQSKTDEISELRVQISNKDQKIASLEPESVESPSPNIDLTDSTFENPIINSDGGDYIYRLQYTTPPTYPDGYTATRAYFTLADGDISSCRIYTEPSSTDRDCSVTGLTDKIYKIVDVGEGQNWNNEIAFILTNGTVEYIDLSELVANGTATIKGSYNINGFVTDTVNVSVQPANYPTGGYSSTFFILSDGTYLPYGQISKN